MAQIKLEQPLLSEMVCKLNRGNKEIFRYTSPVYRLNHQRYEWKQAA